MSGQSPTDPSDEDRPYRSLESIPDRYRLKSYAPAYEGKDTFRSFLTMAVETESVAGVELSSARVSEGRWKVHMATRGRHHALARPVDVESWCIDLLDSLSLETAYEHYWHPLERFYDWLHRRHDHPHSYNPFLLAASRYDMAQQVWGVPLVDTGD